MTNTPTYLILKLTNGEEVIAKFETEIFNTNTEWFNAIDPMILLGMRDDMGFGGGMRLRNLMTLSDEDSLSFPSKHVITYYKPSEVMIDYYKAAVDYNKFWSKREVDSQIVKATDGIRESLLEIDNEVTGAMDEFSRIMGMPTPKGKMQ